MSINPDNEPDQGDDDCLADLLSYINSRPDGDIPRSPLCAPLPFDHHAFFPESPEDADEVADSVLNWMHENASAKGDSRKAAWWIGVIPGLVAGLRQVLLEMPPELPFDVDLTTYQGIDDLVSRQDEITVLQEDTLVAMRVLMVLQIRDIHPSEYQRTIVRLKDVVRRQARELPIWQKQMTEGRITKARFDALAEATDKATVYKQDVKDQWWQVFVELRKENARLSISAAAEKIVKRCGLPDAAHRTVRRELSKRSSP